MAEDWMYGDSYVNITKTELLLILGGAIISGFAFYLYFF